VLVLAAAAALAGSAVWGPLRPLIERYWPAPTQGEESTPDLAEFPMEEERTVGGAEQTGDAAQTGDVLPSSGEGETEVSEETGGEGSVSGEQTTPGEVTRTDQPVTPPADEAAAAREREAEVDRALAAARTAAESNRNSAVNAQRDARAARADELFEDAYANLAAQLGSADRAFGRRQYENASTAFSRTARGFRDLTQRATVALRQGGAAALAAKRAMEGQRDSARAAGAVENAPQGLIGAGIVANQAQSEFERGNYQDATQLFEEAEGLYLEVIATAVGSRVGERTAEEQGAAQEQASDSGAVGAGEPQPQPEEAAREPEVPPEQIIAGLIDRFRVLFEAEDQAGMSRELYRSAIPGGDRRIYGAVFGGADDIEITRFDRQINVDGYQARVDVELHMRFRQGTTREARQRDLKLRLHFEASGPGEWRLRRLETR
jgi:tetratricopeptide (TPR) repeat protein